MLPRNTGMDDNNMKRNPRKPCDVTHALRRAACADDHSLFRIDVT